MRPDKFYTRSVPIAVALAVSALQICSVNAAVTFNFTIGSPFSGAAAGAAMTEVDDTDPALSIKLTSMAVLAPEYVVNGAGTYSFTGNIISAGVTTVTSLGSLGIDNPTIDNEQYSILGGGNGGSSESFNFSVDESWVIKFDTDVIISQFNFASLSPGDAFQVSIEGGTSTSFLDSGLDDDYDNPFNTEIITAGKTITFTALGTLAGTDIRITSLAVNAVPEPASMALLSLGGLLLAPRRRRH